MDNSWKQDEHWKVVNAGGQTVSNTPAQLWNKFVEYMQFCEMYPIKIKRTLMSGKEAGKKVEIEVVRPYNIKAMCLHCNINERWIKDIETTHSKESEWYTIMEKILMIIYAQNLEGGITDIYNPIMVSKVLNMDKSDGSPQGKVTVEIIHTDKGSLPNSESEVLRKLPFEKTELLKEKTENSQKTNS